ncbi:unnamed protein product [Mycena citricolor]|uniref:Uncharacterized protein n=1 Tax=Mycena citricolor TaxID=2018698 RepID=A0AAD2HEP2_9AGAR|nr:unnamed protein product [Mycena citricolor]
MKLFSFLSLALLSVSGALAQSIEIGAPLPKSKLESGCNFTVEVDRPDTLTGSTEVAIAIALKSNTAPYGIGDLLYIGSYNPQFHTGAAWYKPPHQNFSVKVPKDLAHGPALLSVQHWSIVGASQWSLLESKNITVVVT